MRKPSIDKAVKALGGAEKLGAVKAVAWKAKGKISINDNDGDFTSKVTEQGLDHFRQEFEGDFGGNPVKGVVVLDGDKGWRKFGEDSTKLEDEALANQKRDGLSAIRPGDGPAPEGEGFKVESAEEEKVGGKPAAVLKVTGPGRQGVSALLRQGKRPARQTDRNGGRFPGRASTPRKRPSATTRISTGSKGPPRSSPSATARNSSTRRSPSSKCSTRSSPRLLPSRDAG